VFIMGDFNSDPLDERHKFGRELKNFCQAEYLVLSDVMMCPRSTYTYLSEAHNSASWLDHIVCTQSAHNLVENVSVLYETITSDHHPLIATVRFPHVVMDVDDVETNPASGPRRIKWDMLSAEQIRQYELNTEIGLGNIKLTHQLILCDDPACDDPGHISAIDRMYNDIAGVLIDSSSELCSKKCKSYKQIPGWNQYCKTVHSEARESYLNWRENGKPKYGYLFDEMKKSRAYFKFVMRTCKREGSKKSADSLASKLLCKSDKLFWKEIKNINQSNVPVAATIDSVTGAKNITNMWQQHFKSLLNSSSDTSKKGHVLGEVANVSNGKCHILDRFTPLDVKEAMKNIKNGKACGLDGINGEHIKYAHSKLHVLLSLLFNAIIIHGHIPQSLMDTIIVPLVKDKKGNLNTKDNYRPLAITCIISKIFEILILNRYRNLFGTSDNQFGFKSKLCTEMCIFALKQVTDYYVNLGSPMYTCYLDASKAFDKINHWILFSKLLDKNMPNIIVRFLLVWYTKQNFFLRWSGHLSEPFTVSNGVRQGGILSPFFFNVYIDELSKILNNVNDGCIFNGVRINHLLYADDAVLMAPSPHAMQKLLNVCDKFATKHELIYNVKKTFCMCVKPKWLNTLVIPNLYLSGKTITVTNEHKYLGMVIADTMKDDIDMKRQIKGIYSRGNILLKRFGQCNDNVKIKLFKAYCSSFYCLSLWSKFNTNSYRKVKSSYNRIFRNFLRVDRSDMTAVMVLYGVKSFKEIERDLVYSFSSRILSSNNSVINELVNSIFYNSCKLTDYWKSVLY